MSVLARRALRRPILRESAAIAAICFLDMTHTMVVIESGRAVEANPLLAPVVQQGWLAFALVKSASFLLPLAALEGIRAIRPVFTRRALQLGATGYVLSYICASLQVNSSLLR